MNITAIKTKNIPGVEFKDLRFAKYLLKSKLYVVIFYLLLASLSLIPIMSFGEDRPSLPKSNAGLHPLIHKGPLTNSYESLIIGNGDLAVSAQMFSHQLLLRIGKNDIYDSRSEPTVDNAALKHDQLIEANGALNRIDLKRITMQSYTGLSTVQGPTTKVAGMLKISHAGLSDTRITGKVDIATGILSVEYEFPEGKLFIEIFVHKEKNSIITKLSARGKVPWISISLEKTPDYADAEIPNPVVERGQDNRHWAISQTINGKYGVPDFSWHLACLFPEQSEGTIVSQVLKWRYALEQVIETLHDGASVVMSVGVATDREGVGNSLDRSYKLADVTNLNRYEEEKSSHCKSWGSFWAASSIELEDKELEALWYRSLFGFACHLKPGARAPGLNANIPVFDYSAWNGCYTWDHNVQKWYFPAIPVNHPEWYEVFARLIEQNIPAFEHLSKFIFDLDGVYVDMMTFPFAPADRARTWPNGWGRALSLTGWISQMLFQHYEFTNDSDWLRKNAYTFISKAADFYAGYLDKYQGDDKVIFPSELLEDRYPPWGEGFPRNHNVLTDLIMFRKAFESAIKASKLLNVDKSKRKQWEKKLANIPEVEYGWKDGHGWYGIYKDWEKVWPDFNEYLDHIRTSRWGCSGWLVFPGEHIDGDEKTGLAAAVRDVLAGTDLLDLPEKTVELGTFHGEANFLPFIRMGIMEKYHDIRTLLLNHRFISGQFSPWSENVFCPQKAYLVSWRIVENQYFPILGIAEMLLQSQGNIIRLFPYWPIQKSASFSSFRARNGFIVSASLDPGKGMFAKITSLNGNDCRIRCDHEQTPLIVCNDKPVSYKMEGRDIVFKTIPQADYELRFHHKSVR